MRALLLLLAISLAGCAFRSADPDGTAFACTEPDQTCPAGFACDDGTCRRDDDGPDAGEGALDAALLVSDAAAPDAGLPDAAPASVTLTFGEQDNASQQNVTRDTFLAEDDPTTVLGGEQDISVDGGPRHVALVRFDLSAIPIGATVDSADLVLSIFDPIEDGDLTAQVMAVPWSEGTATWNARGTSSWPTIGAGSGSFTPGDIASVSARTIGIYSVSLDLDAVQAWVDSPATNFGMRWISTSTTGRGAQWRSSENTDHTARPLLRVTFH